jgi:hypothetical protein
MLSCCVALYQDVNHAQRTCPATAFPPSNPCLELLLPGPLAAAPGAPVPPGLVGPALPLTFFLLKRPPAAAATGIGSFQHATGTQVCAQVYASAACM